MCVTWCHRTARLYWNHEDCPSSLCQFALIVQGKCADCRYNKNGQCGLTRAALPSVGGCCHCNVELAQGPQPVTPATMTLLWTETNSLTRLLDTLDTPYTVDAAGQLWVDPDELGLPAVYGQGTDEPPAEELPILQNFNFDW